MGWRSLGGAPITRIGATVGNFVVIGPVATIGIMLVLTFLQLWAAGILPGNGVAHDVLVPVGAAFNYATKGL